MNPEAEQEKFEQFLFGMDDILDLFVTQAASAGFVLDYTMESLDRLEAYYLSTGQAGASTEAFISAAARYYGETVRKCHGGQWSLVIGNPKHLLYGLPVITGHAPSRVKLSPHQTFRMFTKGQPAGFLRRVVANHRQPDVLDLTPEV